MGKSGNMALVVAAAIFAVFVANIVAGAMRAGTFLSDVGEMLCLVLACVCFVVAVLQREYATVIHQKSRPIDQGSKETS